MYLRPSDIHYSQDSINIFFDKRSSHNGVRIGQTLDNICDGVCRVESIPTISVMKKNNNWVTADNRRLWVFRQLERLGKLETIYVQQTYYIPDAKMTSINGGTSVEVRGNPGGRWYIKPSVNNPKVPSSPSFKYTDRTSSSGFSGFGHIAPSGINQQRKTSYQPQSPVQVILNTSSSSDETYTARESPVVLMKYPTASNIGPNSESSKLSIATYKSTTRSNDTGSYTHREAFNDVQSNMGRGVVSSTRRVYDATATGSAGRVNRYALHSDSDEDSYSSSSYVTGKREVVSNEKPSIPNTIIRQQSSREASSDQWSTFVHQDIPYRSRYEGTQDEVCCVIL